MEAFPYKTSSVIEKPMTNVYKSPRRGVELCPPARIALNRLPNKSNKPDARTGVPTRPHRSLLTSQHSDDGGYKCREAQRHRSAPERRSRVSERVQQGGHDIPEPVIRRRFDAGMRNFETSYKHLVDSWAKFDNLGQEPILLEWGEN